MLRTWGWARTIGTCSVSEGGTLLCKLGGRCGCVDEQKSFGGTSGVGRQKRVGEGQVRGRLFLLTVKELIKTSILNYVVFTYTRPANLRILSTININT